MSDGSTCPVTQSPRTLPPAAASRFGPPRERSAAELGRSSRERRRRRTCRQARVQLWGGAVHAFDSFRFAAYDTVSLTSGCPLTLCADAHFEQISRIFGAL